MLNIVCEVVEIRESTEARFIQTNQSISLPLIHGLKLQQYCQVSDFNGFLISYFDPSLPKENGLTSFLCQSFVMWY
jgi:hypothetical protein